MGTPTVRSTCAWLVAYTCTCSSGNLPLCIVAVDHRQPQRWIKKNRSISCLISSALQKQRTCQLETTVCALRSHVQFNSTPAVILPLRPFKLNGPFTQKAWSPRDHLNGTIWKVVFDAYSTVHVYVQYVPYLLRLCLQW